MSVFHSAVMPLGLIDNRNEMCTVLVRTAADRGGGSLHTMYNVPFYAATGNY